MPDAAPAHAGTRRRLFLHRIGAERALVLAAGDDVVCVARPVEPEYLGFLSSIGLGPEAANVLVSPRLPDGDDLVRRAAGRLGTAREITLHPDAGVPEVFHFARTLEQAAGRPVRVFAGRPDLTALADQRHLMRARAVELGLPVAEGEVAELTSPFGRRRRDLEPLRQAVERQLRRTGRVLVRGAAGGEGPSAFIVGPGGDDSDGVLRRLGLRPHQRVYLVEVMVVASVCTTVQMAIEPERGVIRRLGMADRRWGRGLVRAGSQHPTAARTAGEMQQWADAFAGWLGDAGYAGTVGLDFVEYRDPATGRPRSFFSGVDPRANEATYALALKRTVAAPGMVSGTLPARLPGFARLRELLGRLLYDPDRGSGVIPYAIGSLEQGRCPLVAVGATRLHAAELLGKAGAAVDSSGGRPVS